MRCLLSVLVLLLILGGLAFYLGDCARDKDSGGWEGFYYWHLRKAPSGLTRPLFEVRVSGRCGFIDSGGQVVIEPRFEKVGRFQEGLCAAMEGGKEGYIDGAGAWVIQPQFVMASSFREGRASVKVSYTGQYGYIDRAGALVIPFQYDTVGDFVDGVARVGHATKLGRIKSGFADVGLECWYEYIDKDGRSVKRPPLHNPPMAAEAPSDLIPFGEPGAMGYKDRAGRVVVPPRYDRADPFEDGLGCVGTDGGRKNGYVDGTGRVVWEPTG